MTMFLLGLIAAAAGAATAFQAAANAGLASRIGLGAALIVNTVIVLLGTIVLYFTRGAHESFFPPGVPWSLYVGASVAIALVVLGQGAAALTIDHFGLMGMPTEPITVTRLTGLLLLSGGVALIRL